MQDLAARYAESNSPKLVDRKAIAARYDVSLRTVDNWRAGRILPFIRVGKVVRFDPAACDLALKAFEVQSISQQVVRKAAIPK